MNVWLCLQGKLVVNAIVATAEFIATDDYVKDNYTSCVNYDDMDFIEGRKPWIGSFLDESNEWQNMPVMENDE